jgi:hypothetical protein
MQQILPYLSTAHYAANTALSFPAADTDKRQQGY